MTQGDRAHAALPGERRSVDNAPGVQVRCRRFRRDVVFPARCLFKPQSRSVAGQARHTDQIAWGFLNRVPAKPPRRVRNPDHRCATAHAGGPRRPPVPGPPRASIRRPRARQRSRGRARQPAPSTDEELQLIEPHTSGTGPAKITKQLERQTSAIRSRLRRLGYDELPRDPDDKTLDYADGAGL